MEWIYEQLDKGSHDDYNQDYSNLDCIRQQELTQSSDSRLGSYRMQIESAKFPVVWGIIVLVCRLRSVTTV